MRKNIYDFDGKLIGFIVEESDNREMHILNGDDGGMTTRTYTREIFKVVHEKYSRPNEKDYMHRAATQKHNGNKCFKTNKEIEETEFLYSIEKIPIVLRGMSVKDLIRTELGKLASWKSVRIASLTRKYFMGDTEIISVEKTEDPLRFNIHFKFEKDRDTIDKWLDDMFEDKGIIDESKKESFSNLPIITPTIIVSGSIEAVDKKIHEKIKNFIVGDEANMPMTLDKNERRYMAVEPEEETQEQAVAAAMKRFC